MRWQAKCLLDSCKGVVPFRDNLRVLKYRVAPFTPDDGKDASTIEEGLTQVEWIRSLMPLEGSSILEIGSGWQPLIPALFSLAGAGRVYLTDVNRLCVPASFQAAMVSLRKHRRTILDRLGISEQYFGRTVELEPGAPLEAAFERLGFEYLAPCDCRSLPLRGGSVDAVVSRAVLEHIPAPVIEAIFAESHRVLKPGGVACHLIDTSDHWEHQDKSISKVNFLKFPDAFFRLTCLNSLNYQNRLRHCEYINMFRNARFSVLRGDRQVDPEAVRALGSLRLAMRFQAFAADDLASVRSSILARKPV